MHNTIKSREEFDRLFGSGIYASSPLVAARICESSKGRDLPGRVAFVAGKKLGNAVVRNRCKRMLREMARRNSYPRPGYDVIFIAKQGCASASLEALDASCRSLERFFKKVPHVER